MESKARIFSYVISTEADRNMAYLSNFLIFFFKKTRLFNKSENQFFFQKTQVAKENDGAFYSVRDAGQSSQLPT